MTLAEVLTSLFPAGHATTTAEGLIFGRGPLRERGAAHIIGVVEGTALGVEGALALAGRVLDIANGRDSDPILVLIDSSSQRMSRRDELLGLNEYLAHLAKALLLAQTCGHRTVGLLYGGSAAGAFIATALSTGTLVALPGAHPAVMDLPSMARVTKLPIEVLQKMAEATPVFAPGLDNSVATGGVAEVWDPSRPLSGQLAALLATPTVGDQRARLGKTRGGRPRAAAIAAEVERLAQSHD